MIYALRLGDIDTGEGPATIYLGLTETTVLPPAIAQSDEAGLRQLLAHVGGAEMVCEPALARAAKKLILRIAPPPPWTLIPCAELATVIHLGPAIEQPALAAVVPALVAAGEFVSAAPWQHFLNADAIDFTVERAAGGRREFEGCIMGAGGQEFGVALYDQPGSLARLAALGAAGRMQQARQIDAFGLTIDDAPTWVANAVERAFEAPVVLSPVRVRRGALRPVSAAELMMMAGATAAAAKLDPHHLEASATFGDGEDAITVVACVRSSVSATKVASPRKPARTQAKRPRPRKGKPRRHG